MTKLTGVFVLATSYSRTAFRRTTIGAAAFHFRVRNGNGWCHHANVTRAEKRLRCSALACDTRFFTSGASHSEAATVDSRFSVHDSDFQRAADPLTPTYRKKNVIRDSLHCYIGFSDSRFNVSTIHGTSRASFCFEIFPLLCLPLRKSAERLNRKVKDQAERVISTPELNTLLCLHPEPINVVVYHDPSGRSHLGIGLALRCFQRLSFPNIAARRCS